MDVEDIGRGSEKKLEKEVRENGRGRKKYEQM